MRKKGFTLIELLVVIAIIAILMGVLLPALSRIREQAKQKRCGSQVRQQVLSLTMWADDNSGQLPRTYGGYWLWDLMYDVRGYLVKSGLTKEMFFCPSNDNQQKHKDLYWDFTIKYDPTTHQATSGYMVAGYCYIVENKDNNRNAKSPILPVTPVPCNKRWLRSTQEKNAAEMELVVDSILSTQTAVSMAYPYGQNFGMITAGGSWSGYQLYDESSHLKNEGRPIGGNAGFLDGHAQWRRFTGTNSSSDIQRRYIAAGPWFWW
jgi:prepilin-type N-terminal cleavage/methylation domain-containing protein/prepilin-type processing-associated H-X9-DG protein